MLQNPLYNSEGFGFSGRILSKYISLASDNNQNVVLIDHSLESSIPPLFKQYLFYNNMLSRKTVSEISSVVKRSNYDYKNFKVSLCPKESLPLNYTIITLPDNKCKSTSSLSKNLSISQLSDGGEIYKIFNDKVCNKYMLNRYPIGIGLNDLEVERLSEKLFCEKFITSFN
ncbi:hypothetical protein C4577_06095 [Candidatus Parcubacteria bacterium]|nr:MAG: hypothetical protein C4577_06095 [Candidatus Parcubacteria bacterium]